MIGVALAWLSVAQSARAGGVALAVRCHLDEEKKMQCWFENQTDRTLAFHVTVTLHRGQRTLTSEQLFSGAVPALDRRVRTVDFSGEQPETFCADSAYDLSPCTITVERGDADDRFFGCRLVGWLSALPAWLIWSVIAGLFGAGAVSQRRLRRLIRAGPNHPEEPPRR